jgi:hypothetical protein
VSAQRHLIRRVNGASAVLWRGSGPLAIAEVSVEAIGNRLRGWIDGQLLFDVYDDGPAVGQAGVLSFDGTAGTWSVFEVLHAQPTWEDWYVFGEAEGWRAAGWSFQVLAGSGSDVALPPGITGEHRIFQEMDPGGFSPRLRAPGVDLRLVAPNGRAGHTRRFLPDTAYTAEPSARVLRAADSTGMLVFVPTSGPVGAAVVAGEYRLLLTYRRNNTGLDADSLVLAQAGDSSDESATLDIPWTAL